MDEQVAIAQVPQEEVEEETRRPVVLLYVPVMPFTLTRLPETAPTPPPVVQGTAPWAVVESANQD